MVVLEILKKKGNLMVELVNQKGNKVMFDEDSIEVLRNQIERIERHLFGSSEEYNVNQLNLFEDCNDGKD